MPTTTLHPSGQYYLKIAAKTSKYIDYEQRTVGNEDIIVKDGLFNYRNCYEIHVAGASKRS